MIYWYTNTVDRISVFVGKICGPFYFMAIALSLYEVFMRYVMDNPTVWTNEIIIALCAGGWMLSGAVVTQQNRHITVTVMEIIMPPKIWEKLKLISLLLSLIAIAGLLWASWTPAMNSITHIERSGSALNSPLPTYLKVTLVFSCILYIMQLISTFLTTAFGHSKK